MLGTGVFFKLGTSIVVGQVRPWIIRLLEEAYRTGLEAVRADKVDLGGYNTCTCITKQSVCTLHTLNFMTFETFTEHISCRQFTN